jgi:hypothetical protein
VRRIALKKKSIASDGKKLSLRVETLRVLSDKEMNQINGDDFNPCWTFIVPSSGIFTLIPATMGTCK